MRLTTTSAIKFVDLDAQRRRLGQGIEEAILASVRNGAYIMGSEVQELEEQLAARANATAVSCSSGTDALILALLAVGIGPGDAVIVPTFTFAATAEAVAIIGAAPLFVDVQPDTFLIDPVAVEGALQQADVSAVIAVDLFGQPADYDRLREICHGKGVPVIGDAAQSFGATWNGKPVGSLADVTTTSFFPAKPLGCYGDGGAVFTSDPALGVLLRSLRVHGQGENKYDNVRVGLNARLDTIQAAVLLQKLTIFDDELKARRQIADYYDELLIDLAELPKVSPTATSTWAQYTVRLDHRDTVAKLLRRGGVPTAIYYPVPLHRQGAYETYPTNPGSLVVSDELSESVLSLPMHPYLDRAAQETIASVLRDAVCG